VAKPPRRPKIEGPRTSVLRFVICSGRRYRPVSAYRPRRNQLEMRFPGSQPSRTPTSSPVFVDSSASFGRAYPKHFIGTWVCRSLRFKMPPTGEQPEPPGFGPETTDLPSNSPLSPVDRSHLLTGFRRLEANRDFRTRTVPQWPSPDSPRKRMGRETRMHRSSELGSRLQESDATSITSPTCRLSD